MQRAPLEFDFDRLQTRVDGQPVAVNGLQLRLLVYLLNHPGGVLTRQQLLSEIWGESHHHHPKAVDVLVCRLRKRLGAAGALIESVRSYGYSFRPGTSNGQWPQ